MHAGLSGNADARQVLGGCIAAQPPTTVRMAPPVRDPLRLCAHSRDLGDQAWAPPQGSCGHRQRARCWPAVGRDEQACPRAFSFLLKSETQAAVPPGKSCLLGIQLSLPQPWGWGDSWIASGGPGLAAISEAWVRWPPPRAAHSPARQAPPQGAHCAVGWELREQRDLPGSKAAAVGAEAWLCRRDKYLQIRPSFRLAGSEPRRSMFKWEVPTKGPLWAAPREGWGGTGLRRVGLPWLPASPGAASWRDPL